MRLRLLKRDIPTWVNAFAAKAGCYSIILNCCAGTDLVAYPESPEDNYPEITNLEGFDSALLDAALVQRQQGGFKFKASQWSEALIAYQKGVNYLEHYTGDESVVMQGVVAEATGATSVKAAMAASGADIPLGDTHAEIRLPSQMEAAEPMVGDDDDDDDDDGEKTDFAQEGDGGDELVVQIPGSTGNIEEVADKVEHKEAEAGDRVVVKDVLIIMEVNIAACLLKLEDYSGAIEQATKVLNLAPRHAKAFYRRAVALRSLGKLEEAELDLIQASAILPNDKAMSNELEKIKRTRAKQARDEKAMYQKMFAKPN